MPSRQLGLQLALESVSFDGAVYRSSSEARCIGGLEPCRERKSNKFSLLTFVAYYGVDRCAAASSFIVLVSFIWGIFVFGEPIYSKFGASFAVLCLIAGLFGMSYYSSPHITTMVNGSIPIHQSDDTVDYRYMQQNESEDDDDNDDGQENVATDGEAVVEKRVQLSEQSGMVTASRESYSDLDNSSDPTTAATSTAHAHGAGTGAMVENGHAVANPLALNTTVEVCGWHVPQRRLGMGAAAFCGIWGGSIMAPMKFCRADTKGTHYLLSFAIGAAIVNAALWLLRYLYHVIKHQSWKRGYETLPSFHFRVMWRPGGLSGLLWSIGNFFSLISVFYLGEGVGYPLVQTSILVAGLWGIFYFKEVKGTESVLKWLLSASLTVFGILLLSYEHHKS
jgi:Transmembrane family, TMEM144 of transporters